MLIFTVVVLSVVVAALLAYVFYYKRQIKNIGEQLAFILDKNSNKFIQTDLHPKEISRLVRLCNTLLNNQRELERKFASRNEIINQTIVNLSHDIRTPLTSLDGYVQLANNSNDLEMQQKYIDMAHSRIKQINSLVDELFLYAKLQNPDYELELHAIDIRNHLHNQLFKFIQNFTEQHREPKINLPEHSIHIRANEHALERVIENIINNYFIHGAGDLVVSSSESPGSITLKFSNQITGTGNIDINNIFTQFYKEDHSRAEQSSGLGLSIVRALMLKMNGSASANIDKKTFTIELTFKKL